MHQHLVDHHLEEQRRHQRENLQEEGGDQHLAQQAAVLVDRSHEPGDVEASRQIAEPGALAHQDQAAVPRRLELGLRHHHRPGRAGKLHDGLAVAGLAENQEAAIAQRDDGRERGLVQPSPRSLLRDAPLCPNCFAQRSISLVPITSANLMADLLRVSRHAQESQQHDERGETRIGGRAGRRARCRCFRCDSFVDTHTHHDPHVTVRTDFHMAVIAPSSQHAENSIDNVTMLSAIILLHELPSMMFVTTL